MTSSFDLNKGNNKITELRQQPENCENRNDPDLVPAFLKKWWVESDFKAPNIPLSLRFKPYTSKQKCNRIGGVMVSVLASSAVDRGFVY